MNPRDFYALGALSAWLATIFLHLLAGYFGRVSL